MNKKLNTVISDIVFIGPVVAAFTAIVLIPLFVGIVMSFTNWNGVYFTKVVGFTNYIKALSDKSFLSAFWLTFRFSLAAVCTINFVGFSLALLVTQPIPGSSAMRGVFYLPNLIGGLTLGFVWNFIFVEIFPAIGKILGTAVLDGWLSDAATGFTGLVILTTWQMSGYMMVIYIAAISNIPVDLIEASMIDGASAWKRLTNITLPLVAPAFTISIFLTFSHSFKMYDQNLSLTGGGPGTSTQMVSMNIYNTAYTYDLNALGQAKAILFLIVVVCITLTQVYLGKKKEVQM